VITGNTRLFAIIADPIAQVRTPEVFNEYFRAQRMDAVLVPIQVAPEGLADVVTGLRAMSNLGGFIVTVPHKISVAALCDELGPTGRATVSVNTVRRTADGRLIGDMFDGEGFVRGLRGQGNDPAGKRVLLLGSGGAAGAIAFALAQAGTGSITIANRTRSRAEHVVKRVREFFPQANIAAGDSDPRGFDIVVNATSLGMKPTDPLPLDTDKLQSRTLVAEVVMKPELTPLLERARSLGCPIHFGRHMLDEQARLMAHFMLEEA